MSKNLFLIVGLGNPGKKYVNNRHNIGFKAIDYISQKYGIKLGRLRCKAVTGEGEVAGRRVLLAMPQTFMNASGDSVLELTKMFNIEPQNMLIIYDDVDLELGKIRIRKQGSAGTHNGMKSIIWQLGHDEFPRLRIGMGRPPEDVDLASHVLNDVSLAEAKILFETLGRVCEALEEMFAGAGIDAAMNKFNAQ